MSLGSTVALALERIVEPVEGMQRAIAGGWLAALGPVGRPVRLAHDAVARVVYGSIRLGAAAVGVGLDTVGAVETRTAESVQALVNGLWGDALGRHEDRLGMSMSLRDGRGAPVAVGSELAAAFPAATGQLVVLVHGLIKTERCWHDRNGEQGLIGSLEDHPSLTPIAIRYNTGIRVAANGARLASLLDEVHSGWLVPVQSIALVGHSMGGLVVDSACTAARQAGYGWIDDVSDVVTIGSPHRGAPLEKLVNVVAQGLRVAPQTRPLADFLNTRSAGIKDLRIGVIAEDDPKRTKSDDERAIADDTAMRPDIRYHFVAGVITSDPTHPLGAVVGDLMVRPASGTASPQLDPTNVVVLGGVHHFGLLHDPTMIDRVMGWLSSAT
jgi:hypothetical protein